MSDTPFTLGDHTFLAPGEQGSLSRLDQPPRQIRGAPPPGYLDGRVREAPADSPVAAALLLGEFCGHGEPTMTVFEVLIDGEERLELGVILDDDEGEVEQNVQALVVRRPGGAEWFPLFRREWEEEQQGLPATAAPLTAEEAARVSDETYTGRAAIGFEYPVDATSRDEVSWLTIDILLDGEDEPQCVVNAELL